MREPTVDPALIRAVMTAGPGGTRPTSSEAAKVISEHLGTPVAAGLIRSALARHRWDEVPQREGGRPRAMDYTVEADLGPISPEHKKSHHWLKMTTYERHRAGRTKGGRFVDQAISYVETRLAEGLVTDYDPQGGWTTRPAWPWEIAVAHYRQPAPPGAREGMALNLADPPAVIGGVRVTEAHVTYWQEHLDTLPGGE